MELYLLRHPKPDCPDGWCYGQTDLGLAPGFETALDAARQSLPPLRTLCVMSSDLQRCKLAAAYLKGSMPETDIRLRELDFGSWENRPWQDISRTEIDHWASDYVNLAPPGGESFAQLLKRCDEMLAQWRTSAEPILAVTHAGWIRAAKMLLEGATAEQVFAEKVPFCKVIQFELQGS